MKVIDLLNKIANGEEIPKKIRIDHWCYKFEWDETAGNYFDEKQNIDLMSCLSMDKEELNYEIHELEEDKKIEHINKLYDITKFYKDYLEPAKLLKDICDKQYELIDEVNKLKGNK